MTDHTEMFRFLNRLRESGKLNMFGASPVLSQVFDLSPREARTVLTEWMAWVSENPSNLEK